MARGGITWTDEQRARRREEYARNHQSKHAGRAQGIIIPADITILTRDPSPCFRCEAREGCRHRPWMLAPNELEPA